MEPLSIEQKINYLQYARNPDTWLFAAKKHFAVASIMRSTIEQIRNGCSTRLEESAGCRDAYYLHAGMALENAAKAILIKNDHLIVSESGKFDRKRLGCNTGHEISILVKRAIGELDPNSEELLRKLEEYVLWASRYTVPVDGTRIYNTEIKSRLRLSNYDEFDQVSKVFELLLEHLHTSENK